MKDIVDAVSNLNEQLQLKRCIVKPIVTIMNRCGVVTEDAACVDLNTGYAMLFKSRCVLRADQYTITKELKGNFFIAEDGRWVVDQDTGVEYSVYLLKRQPEKFMSILGEDKFREVMSILDIL